GPSLPRWAVPAVAAAAAAAVILWVKLPSREPAPAPVVALASALAPERGVDVRFSAPALDGYRPRGVVRSTSIVREAIDVEQLAALKQRNELHALVGAHALKGEIESAGDQAGELPETTATLSDRAALALLAPDPDRTQANAERALSLVAR